MRRKYLTADEMADVRTLVARGAPLPTVLAERLLHDHDAWCDRAFGRAPTDETPTSEGEVR